MHAVVEDPPPPELVRDTHYIVSNESRQDLFKDSIAAHGGALLGVGSDQNYLLAGWSRPELLILFDFDQVVVNVHRVYRAFFLNAATPRPSAACGIQKMRRKRWPLSMLRTRRRSPRGCRM